MRELPEYTCNFCDYTCSVKRLYRQHLRTLMHKVKCGEITDDEQIKCRCCGNVFGSRTTLWRHKQGCTYNNDDNDFESDNENEQENQLTTTSNAACDDTQHQTKKTSSIDETILVEVLKETKNLRDAFVEQTKTIESLRMENERQHRIIEEALPHLGSTTNNITNVNSNFNINVFLNEHCKNALNLSDFVNSITVQIEDLDKTKNLGYVKGITDIIVKNLRELDIYTRPIHCSDARKEIMYVKNDNIWSQDKDDKPLVRNAINVVAKKQINRLKDWDEHQTKSSIENEKTQTINGVGNLMKVSNNKIKSKRTTDKLTDDYMKLVKHATGSTDDEDVKIIKNIAREVVVKPVKTSL